MRTARRFRTPPLLDPTKTRSPSTRVTLAFPVRPGRNARVRRRGPRRQAGLDVPAFLVVCHNSKFHSHLVRPPHCTKPSCRPERDRYRPVCRGPEDRSGASRKKNRSLISGIGVVLVSRDKAEADNRQDKPDDDQKNAADDCLEESTNWASVMTSDEFPRPKRSG